MAVDLDLQIEGNPFHCDERMQWILFAKEVTSSNHSGIDCVNIPSNYLENHQIFPENTKGKAYQMKNSWYDTDSLTSQQYEKLT